jgi:hypothetical protein
MVIRLLPFALPRSELNDRVNADANLKLTSQSHLYRYEIGCNQTFTHQKLKMPALSLAPANRCSTSHPHPPGTP